MIYVPMLKNRSIEMNIIRDFTQHKLWGPFIIPLIELVQEKTKTNAKATTIEELTELISTSNQKMFIDFYHSTRINNTQQSIKEYLAKINRSTEFHLQEMEKFKEVNQCVIPVVSYLPELPLDAITKQIKRDSSTLKNLYPTLAFRIRSSNFNDLMPSLKPLMNKNDFLLLDIGNASYSNPVFNKTWIELLKFGKDTNTRTIILNDNRPSTLYNKNMNNNEPIPEIDNGLRDFFQFKHFDGFGDYAGITSALPSTGGSISPAGVYYSKEYNCFIAYRGKANKLSEFPDTIAPNIYNSEYWKEFSDEHHQKCPGCMNIARILDKDNDFTGKSQAIWKGIEISHYIYSIAEYMQSINKK